jgi:4-hydroxy-2-oxoheptanedioate aldolase
MKFKNSFKQSLFDKKTLIGLWLALADSYSAEICAGAGFDWVLLDGEHSPIDLRTILAQLQSISPYDVQAVVRPPVGDTVLIKQLLDIGVMNLLVPMVDTKKQAQTIINATRYPPHGIRGMGAGIARAARWGRDVDYVANANNEICVLLQIESLEGINNLDEIAAIDGVDGLFFGAVDLSASMGLAGQPNHPDVVALIDEGIRKVKSHGKASGLLSVDEKMAHHYIQTGANFVAVGVDTLMLTNAANRLVGEFKKDSAKTIQTSSY